MVFLRLRGAAHLRISATPQTHLQTVHIHSYVLISEVAALAILLVLLREHFGAATLSEKEKETDFISPVEGNYIYWHPEHTHTHLC